MTTSFNLVHEPWILAQDLDNVEHVVSLRELFSNAGDYRQLLGDLPSQTFSVYRLLLAILHRAARPDATRWNSWWRNKKLPADDVLRYLDEHHDRFDLLHPEHPFYQVAGLHTSKNEFTELTRLIGDAGSDYLSTKAGEATSSIPLAEAARWVVHCQAFDVSGIKSGAVGDPRVKGGKGYPIGVGATGQIGGILVEGPSLLETLLLNLVPQDDDTDYAAWELDGWEAAPRFPDSETAPYRPRGRAEILTWQTRRIRLQVEEDRATGVLIANGDRFSPVNLERHEVMTSWRESKPQAQKLKIPLALMPRGHVPGREIWRGLEALLSSGSEPGNLAWVESRVGEEVVSEHFVPRVRAIGMDYINNASITGEVINEELALPVRVLREVRPELTQVVVKAVQNADACAQAYANLAANLQRAAGGEGTSRDAARQHLYGVLDEPFRVWLERLGRPDVTATNAELTWSRQLLAISLEAGSAAVRGAGEKAWVGRSVNGQHLDSGLAEVWFRSAIRKIVKLDSLKGNA